MLKNLQYQADKSGMIKIIIIYYLILFIFFILPVELIQHFFFQDSVGQNNFTSISQDFYFSVLMTCLISPIIETIIFQIILIKITYLSIRESQIANTYISKVLSIIISALIFGLSHFYNTFYIISMIIFGIYLGIFYYHSLNNNIKPIYSIVIVHSLYNFTVIILQIYE